MSATLHILKQYWGYDTFRSVQESIINTVLQGKDVLAVLPTGAGKSICFQIPAMANEGICIVVSPLIALMKDQVQQLTQRGITALCVYSGLSYQEIDNILDRCAYDASVKFLYLSPERLSTEIFLARLPKFKVNLVAIDEAHCISQWGYDFRPSYLTIAALRNYLEHVPFIALTASATPLVQDDICNNLQMKKPARFQISFKRDNLSYSCIEELDKEAKLLKILKGVPGAAIIYVKTRALTKKIALFLQKNKIEADYYHAGLTIDQRQLAQQRWIEDKCSVIVATNAFGMGIDKANVRLVIHYNVPLSPEAYYQEAGRAGRDLKKSYAVMLYQPQELQDLIFAVKSSYPELAQIKKVYQMIANYLQIAVGGSQGVSYDFDIEVFCETYQIKQTEVVTIFKILEKENLILLTQDFYNPARLYFLVNNTVLYAYQIKYPKYDVLIKTILRMYGGDLFTQYLTISENRLAHALQMDTKTVEQYLKFMAQSGIVNYIPQKNTPQLTFLTPRHDAKNIPLNIKQLQNLKQNDLERVGAMQKYVMTQNKCRSLMLCNYFDPDEQSTCGICDNCIRKKKSVALDAEITSKILKYIEQNPITTEQLLSQFSSVSKYIIIKLLRFLRNKKVIIRNSNNCWQLIP